MHMMSRYKNTNTNEQYKEMFDVAQSSCSHWVLGEVVHSSRVVICRPVDGSPHRLALEQTNCFDVILWEIRLDS